MKKKVFFLFWIIFFVILFFLLSLIFLVVTSKQVLAENCFYEYLDQNSVYVGQMDNLNDSILNLNKSLSYFDVNKTSNIDKQPNWNKTVGEYNYDASYAGEKLREGWYIHLYCGENTLCGEFFISNEGYLMRVIKHPC